MLSLSSLLLASAANPVIDIDYTALIQGGLFLLLVVVLQPLLFKPWLAARDRRAQRIEGATTEAALLREQAGEKIAEYEGMLGRAREKALALRSAQRKTAATEEASILSEARREAAGTLDAVKQRLDTDVERARGELQDRVAVLAGDITSQVLGRPV